MQKSALKNYEIKFKDIGFSFELKELFPYKYSRPQCEDWFEKIKIFSEEKNEKWIDFYNNFVMPFQEEKFLKFLVEGRNPKEEIISNEKTKNKTWDEFLILNEEIKEEMKKCPYVQWFDPEEYKENLLDASITNLLSIIKLSRMLGTSFIILKATGKDNEAENLLMELYEAKEKMKIKSQFLINTLIGIAMEKLYLIGEATSFSMDRGFSDEKLKRIENISKDDLSCFISSFNVEFYSFFSYFKNPKAAKDFELQVFSIRKEAFKYIPEFIFRAFLYSETKNYLYNAYQFFAYLKKAKAEENKFNWKDFKNIKLKKSYLYQNINSAYARNLTIIAQARALLLSKEILNYYNENKKLPENIDFIENPNLIDPFSEKKLIYKKVGEDKFLVYSTGWDEKDDGGKDLYIFGAINIEKLGRDIGFCFSVK